MQPRARQWTARLAVVLGVGLALVPAGGAAYAFGPGSGTVRLPTTVEQGGLTTSVPHPAAPRKPAPAPATPARSAARRAPHRTPAPHPTGGPAARTALPTVLAAAQAQVGGPEERYTADWSFWPGFWCAKFVSWVLAHAGVAVRSDGPGELARLVPAVATPRPGDLVFINLTPTLPGTGTSHVGIVEAVEPDGSVRTIEGNADRTHRVVRNTRRGAEIVGFGRPPAPVSSTVIPAPPAPPPCDWVALGKPWLCS